MSDMMVKKDREFAEVTVIENAFIKGFLASAPEHALKVYLYGLMLLSGASDADGDIASALNMKDEDVRSAFAYWQSAGLVTVIAEEPLQVKYNSARSAAADLARMDTPYADFLKELQKVLGTRVFSGREIKEVYDWIEVYGFEQAAAIEIVRRCLDKKGPKISINYMSSVALNLAGEHSLTVEGVIESFAREDLLSGGAARVRKALGRRGGFPTTAEAEMYEKWTNGWGFTEDIILRACEKTTSAERATFKYIDSILEDWHKKGSVSDEDIRELERKEDNAIEVGRVAFDRAGLKTKPNADQMAYIRSWLYENAVSCELIYLAAELAKPKARPFVAMRNIVNEWKEKGISSLSAARAYYEAHQKDAVWTKNGKKNRALNYMQRGTYTKDKLKELGVSLGEEFYTDDD